jgi:glycosyl transferase family 87
LSTLRAWGRSLVERRLNSSYIQFVCLLVLTIYLLVLAVSFATHTRGQTIFGPYLGADFGAFYIAGRIFNTQAPDRIYDTALHQQLYKEQFPDAPADSNLPYVNAPFFILPFTLLARLPYSWAYFCWLVFSVLLYVAGLRLIWKILDGIPADAWLTCLLLALSFMPFLVECLAGGQTSAVGFFFLAFVIFAERRGQYFLCGLALSVCAYKPTLLLLILPMLLTTRRYSTLLSFVAGCGGLAFISLLTVGWQGCVAFIKTLLYFTNASASAASGLRSWKYVDINSFFRTLLGNYSYLRWTMTGAVFLIFLTLLVRPWWQADTKRRTNEGLVWALTLTWTLVLNLYVGIYDASLVVLSVLLTTDMLYRRAANSEFALSPVYKLLLLLLYLVPWITQPIARITGLQLYTLVLALFGSYQISRWKQLASETKKTA